MRYGDAEAIIDAGGICGVPMDHCALPRGHDGRCVSYWEQVSEQRLRERHEAQEIADQWMEMSKKWELALSLASGAR